MIKEFEFEVLLDEELVTFADETIAAVGNENLLSIVNDYEEGVWRYRKFARFIWNSAKESALTAAERVANFKDEATILATVAERLRLSDDNGKGSELAEIFLYGIMRRYYGALPVVPKIWHKQNRNDNVKGADSVHIVIKDGDTFELWLGEAKFYTTIKTYDLNHFIESVEQTLSREAIRKENSFVIGLKDLEQLLNEEYAERKEVLHRNIMRSLSDKTSLDEIKTILHIPILLIDNCAITKEAVTVDNEYREAIKLSHKERAINYFQKQIELLKNKIHHYDKIHFHLILFPVPDKSVIVEQYLSCAKNLRQM